MADAFGSCPPNKSCVFDPVEDIRVFVSSTLKTVEQRELDVASSMLGVGVFMSRTRSKWNQGQQTECFAIGWNFHTVWIKFL